MLLITRTEMILILVGVDGRADGYLSEVKAQPARAKGPFNCSTVKIRRQYNVRFNRINFR